VFEVLIAGAVDAAVTVRLTVAVLVLIALAWSLTF